MDRSKGFRARRRRLTVDRLERLVMRSAPATGARQDVAGVGDLVIGTAHAPTPIRAPEPDGFPLAGVPHDVESFVPGEDILLEGEPFPATCILIEGWACRYKMLSDGRRQIIGFVLAGDLCSSWAAGSGPMDYGVRALTFSRVARIEPGDLAEAIRIRPVIADSLRAAAAQDQIILGQWLLNMGQRKAPERIAHLFCELATRMRKAGIAPRDGGYEAPLTQQDLADALGLTSVHVNRVLQKLRERDFIGFRRGVLSIRDVDGLCSYVEFKEAYLTH